MKISILALFLLAIGISSCAVDEMPVASGDSAYGLLSDKNMCDYYYPKQAGWTYVYQNTIQEMTTSGSKVLASFAGPFDTVRTLGFQGFSPDGDTLYGVDVTYRVLLQYGVKNPLTLYYVKQGSSHNGGFIVGNNPTGYTTGTIGSITTAPAAIDTILYAVDGPLRDVIDSYNPNAQYQIRTDRILFTAKEDSVVLWYHDGPTMPFRRVRQLWYKNFDKNDDWQYATWDHYTYFKVADADVAVPTLAGAFQSAEIQVTTEDLNTPVKEFKYWAQGTGLVKQIDEWRITSDGTYFKKRIKTRELMSKTFSGPIAQ